MSVCALTLKQTLRTLEDKLLKNKEYAELPRNIKSQFKEILDAYKKIAEETTVADFTVDSLDAMKINIRRDILNVLNSQRSIRENSEFMDSLLKLGFENKTGITNKIKDFYQRTFNIVDKEVRYFNRLVESSFDDIYKRGQIDETSIKQAKELLLNHIAGGRDFITYLKNSGIEGYENQYKAVAKLLVEGHYEGNTVLSTIGKAFKIVDAQMEPRIARSGAPFTSLKNHLTKINPHRGTVLAMGKPAFTRLAHNTVDFAAIFDIDAKKITARKKQNWIDQAYKDATSTSAFGTPSSVSSIGIHREIKFLNNDAMIEYTLRTAKPGDDILRSVYTHRKNTLVDAKYYELHGHKYDQSAEVISETILKNKKVHKLLGADAERFVNTSVKRNATKAGSLQSSRTALSENANAWYNIISNTASGILTGWTGMRNLVYDNTFHRAWQLHHLNNNSFLYEWSRAWSEQISGMAKIKKTKELANILEDMGVSIYLSTNRLTQGIMDSVEVARTNRAEYWSHKFAETIGKATLGDWSFASQRVQSSQHVSSLLERAFKDGWKNMDSKIQRYFVESGVTKDQFEEIAKLPKIMFDNKVVGVDFRKVKELTPDAFQTTRQALTRLEDAYSNLHTNMLNDLIATRTLKGSVSDAIATDHPLDRLIFKFWGMPLSQYRSLTKVTRLASGLDPDQGDFMALADLTKTGPGVQNLSKFMLLAPMAGIQYMWIRDLLEGRNPRDVTPYTLTQAMAFTGMGGIYTLIAQDLYYNQDVIGSPIGIAAEGVKDIGRAAQAKDGDALPRALAKTGKKLPYMNLFFTSLAYDLMVKEGLGIKPSKYREKLDRDRNNETLY